jgi:hypothetical protein
MGQMSKISHIFIDHYIDSLILTCLWRNKLVEFYNLQKNLYFLLLSTWTIMFQDLKLLHRIAQQGKEGHRYNNYY